MLWVCDIDLVALAKEASTREAMVEAKVEEEEVDAEVDCTWMWGRSMMRKKELWWKIFFV